MEPAVMQSRQQAYIEILKWGLLAIREAACAGKTKLCEIEADHIHNLPSLLNEPNEKRHHCYIVPERQYYIEQLEKQGAVEYGENQMRWYNEPWTVLMKAALAELEAGNPAAHDQLVDRDRP